MPGKRYQHILLLAHGAGAGMEHPFMESLAARFEKAGIATLRFQFPYMEEGKRRPDRPAVAHAAIQQAFLRALDYGKKYHADVFAGGKSFGGRMVSQAAALGLISGAYGLIFFGFPLHAAGKPGTQRAEHLSVVSHSMLFFQGTRDALADPVLIRKTVDILKNAKLCMFEGADHGFRTPKSSRMSADMVMDQMVDESVQFMSS